MRSSNSDRPMSPITDLEITDVVRANLDRDDRLSDPPTVGVVVINGVVTLSGTVPSEAQKLAATQDGWNAPGVADVIDEIVVVPAVTRSDAAMAADVRDALDHDPAVDAHDQVQRAADDARGGVGVVNAVNRLSTAP